MNLTEAYIDYSGSRTIDTYKEFLVLVFGDHQTKIEITEGMSSSDVELQLAVAIVELKAVNRIVQTCPDTFHGERKLSYKAPNGRQ